MTPEQIRDIALEVAANILGRPVTNVVPEEIFVDDFAVALLAAITEKAEPVAEVHGDPDYVHTWQVYPIKRGSYKPGDKLFLHPAIEPAPQDSLKESSSPEWLTPERAAHIDALCAAPLPDDVAELVARLRGYHICTVTNNEAADMIERLANRAKNAINEMEIYRDENENLRRLKDAPATPVARQVPPDCVVVPKDLIDAAKNLISVKGRHHTELAYKQLLQSLIAAGEVK